MQMRIRNNIREGHCLVAWLSSVRFGIAPQCVVHCKLVALKINQSELPVAAKLAEDQVPEAEVHQIAIENLAAGRDELAHRLDPFVQPARHQQHFKECKADEI